MSAHHALAELPQHSGAYRWYYADVSAGDLSAVCIFMVGSLFSPRYAVAARRGGRPLEYCAVNFALYERGVGKIWVLSEYPLAAGTETSLRIGRSSLEYTPEGGVRMDVDERSAPWGRPVRASLSLTPECPSAPEVRLVEGLSHHWQPLAPRARARLSVHSEGIVAEGHGYHDTNHGAEPLGGSLPFWSWRRTHLAESTVVDYRLPAGSSPVRMVAQAGTTRVETGRPGATGDVTQRTGWGLKVPARWGDEGQALGTPRLLESSPFYARLESKTANADSLGEVADFRRFQSPFIRWMAHFRTRVESVA